MEQKSPRDEYRFGITHRADAIDFFLTLQNLNCNFPYGEITIAHLLCDSIVSNLSPILLRKIVVCKIAVPYTGQIAISLLGVSS